VFEFSPPPEPDDEQLKFSVYVHYLAAVGAVIRSSFTSTREMGRTLIATPQFQKLKTRTSFDRDLLEKFLRNAWFTEIQARIPRKMAEVIPYANHWLAVQMYYCIYLAVRAYFLAAFDQKIPESHEAALKSFAAEVMSRPALFASPWCMLAVDDPDVTTPTIRNCPKTDLKAINPLVQPVGDNIWHLTALFLRTTRQRRLEKSIAGWKEKNKRKAIRSGERAKLVDGLRPTTLMDALYRLRIRSNYEDADLYLTGSASEADAIIYFDSCSRILKSGLMNFELLIAKLIGKDQYGDIVADFSMRERSNFSKTTVLPRWRIIDELL